MTLHFISNTNVISHNIKSPIATSRQKVSLMIFCVACEDNGCPLVTKLELGIFPFCTSKVFAAILATFDL
ncbi:hypothetical protein DR79_2119 [Francisella tularensis]|nr:hypothetical protein DR79_2119 [Francisella tularensis]